MHKSYFPFVYILGGEYCGKQDHWAAYLNLFKGWGLQPKLHAMFPMQL